MADRRDAPPFFRSERPLYGHGLASAGFTASAPGVLRPGAVAEVWYDYRSWGVGDWWFDLPDLREHASRDFYMSARVVFDGGETVVVAGPWRLVCCSD